MRKRVDHLLGLYLSEIHVEKFLTAEEEVALSKIIQARQKMQEHRLAEARRRAPADKQAEVQIPRDEVHDKARNELVRRNLPLVVHIAKKMRKKSAWLTTAALIEVGNSALIRAAERFTADHGARFTTYATECIEKKMINVIAAVASLPRTVSLDEPTNRESGIPRIDYESDHKAVSPYHGLEQGTIKEVISEVLAELDPEEREVISLAYGLGDHIYHTLKEISQRMNIGVGRVHSLKGSAERKMARHKKLHAFRPGAR